MTHRSAGLLTAGILALAPASAQAARVTVRVEGAHHTLVSQRTVTTPKGPVVKDGDPSHGCPGSSAAGALEAATHGRWTASYSDGLGYFVTGIRGEKPSGNHWFAFWVDGKSSQVGLCGAKLRTGDAILLFVDDARHPVLPLVVRAPRHARAGSRATVRVSVLSAAGKASPARGVRVLRDGHRAGRTDAHGRLRVRLPRHGAVSFTATGRGFARSAATRTRVTRG